MVDSEQQAESPAPDTGGGSPPPAPGGTPSPAPSRPRTAPPPTNGQLDDEFELRYASEARAELVSLLSTGPSVRNGDSDRIEVGKGYEEYGPQSYVQGTDRLDVGGNYTEHTGSDGITQSTRMSTTVQGHLNLKGKGDTGILGGTLVDTHVGPEFLAAGMSDDLIVGVGVRTTVAGDLWLCGLMGMEEKIGTAAMDGALVELYGMSFEREFGAGLHNSGAVTFSGPLFLTTASGFRPLLKAMSGPRNLTPGSGAPAGGASSSPPPAAPAAGDGGMLMDPAIASGADSVAAAEDTQDARYLLVVADVHVDAAPARTGETADNLADAQRLADTSGEGDAVQQSRDYFMRAEAEGLLDYQRRLADAEAPNNRNLVVVEDASGQPVFGADGTEENVLDDLLEQRIDYPDTQHVDQAGDGANPPPAAMDGLPAPAGDGGPAPDDGPVYGPDPRYGPDFPERRYTDAQPRIHADPLSYNYQEVADYAGAGRWDRLLSQDVQSVNDGHATHKMQVAKEQSLAHVDQVIADLIATDPGLYGPEKLDDYSNPSSRGDQFRRLNSLRDRFAAAGDDAQSLARTQAVQDAIDQINWGVHARLYPALEDAENAFVLRKPLADDLDQNLLTEMFTTRIRQLQDEWADLDALGLNRTAEETAQMQSASDELMAIQGALDEVRRGYDPLHFLDGMIDLRTSTYGPDGADEYKIVRLDVERMIDAVTPIRGGLVDPETTGVGLTRFDFKRVEDPEVLDVIRNNKGILGDTHTRADTAADHLAAELKVGNSPQLDDLLETLKARKDELGEAPENAEQLAEIMPTLNLLEKHRANPYSLKPTDVEDLIHLELSTLSNMPETPENTARIIELNNALVTLDQRMRIIMGDGLLWADQVGTDPQKAVAVKDRAAAAQTAWVMTQKSESHMRVFLETGDTYELHLANMYDLAARDLRRNIDPTDVLTGLGEAPYLDPEVQKAANAVLADATYEDASKMAFTPGILADAEHRDAYRPYELDPALHLGEYWNPKAFSGDSIDPTKNGPRKWWKSLKGIKKRVGGAMLTMQGIHTPDRYGRTWIEIMFETPEQSTARRLRSQQNRQMHADALSLADNSRDATRQGLDLRPAQLVPDGRGRGGAEPELGTLDDPAVQEDLLRRVREMDANYEAERAKKPPPPVEGSRAIPPVGEKQQAMIDEMRKRADLAHERMVEQQKWQNLNQGVKDLGLNAQITARTEEGIWKKLATHLEAGYDPVPALAELRREAQESGSLENPAVRIGFGNVNGALKKMDRDPNLNRVDYLQTMKWFDEDHRADAEASNLEAYAHMKDGREDATEAARDALREIGAGRERPSWYSGIGIWNEEGPDVSKMDFEAVMDRLDLIYNTAVKNDDTQKTRKISAVLDELDVKITDRLREQEDKARIARTRANQEISSQYNKQQVVRHIEERRKQALSVPVEAGNVRERELLDKKIAAWDRIDVRLRDENIDPQSTAEDFLNSALLNDAPAEEIAAYRGIVDEVIEVKRAPRSRNMAPFPDHADRKKVIKVLDQKRDALKAQQVDQLDATDPRHANVFQQFEFEIQLYDDLGRRVHDGEDPLTHIANMRRDLEASGESPETLAIVQRVEADLGTIIRQEQANFATGVQWYRSSRELMNTYDEAGHQSSAAVIERTLQNLNENSVSVWEKTRLGSDSEWVRAQDEPGTYPNVRGMLTYEMNRAAQEGRHADATALRVKIDDFDQVAQGELSDAYKMAEQRRALNQRKIEDALNLEIQRELNPDMDIIEETSGAKRKSTPNEDAGKTVDQQDYLERIGAEYRRVTAELDAVPEGPEGDRNRELLEMQQEAWYRIGMRGDEGYDPVATAEDLWTTAMIKMSTADLDPVLVEENITIYADITDLIKKDILPKVKRIEDTRGANKLDDPLAVRPRDLDFDPAAEPADAQKLIMDHALESDAFLDEVARRYNKDKPGFGIRAVDEWINSYTARLEELQEGDGDLLARPGGGARDLPPDWKPPASPENPQPILDSNGARWGDGGPVPDIDEAEFPVVPVREKPKPVPDDAGAAPPPAGNKRPQPDDTADQPPLGPDEWGGAGPPPPAPENKRPRPDNPYSGMDEADPPPPVSDRPRPGQKPRPDNPYSGMDEADPPPPVSDRPRPGQKPRPDNPYSGMDEADPPPPVSDRPRPGQKPRGDNPYSGMDEADPPPPVSDRPRPGQKPRGNDPYSGMDEADPPPPVSDKPRPGQKPRGNDPYSGMEDVADRPPEPGPKPLPSGAKKGDGGPTGDDAYFVVEREITFRREKNERVIQPEDFTRTPHGMSSTRFEAFAEPPDWQSGGRYIVEIDTNINQQFSEFGNIWGPGVEKRITIAHPDTLEVLDPSQYVFRIGYTSFEEPVLGPPTKGGQYPTLFVVTKILNGDDPILGTAPAPVTDIDALTEAARSRRRARRSRTPLRPGGANPPAPGRLQDNLNSVLDGIPPPQIDDSGRAASPEAGGVFYPPADHRTQLQVAFDNLREGSDRLVDRYQRLAEAHEYRPDVPLGTERGFDYVMAPPTSTIVPPVPSRASRSTMYLPAKPSKTPGGLPRVKLGKAEQADILAGAPLRVQFTDGSGTRDLLPSEYEVVIISRGKTHRMVTTSVGNAYDAELLRWVQSIRYPSK